MHNQHSVYLLRLLASRMLAEAQLIDWPSVGAEVTLRLSMRGNHKEVVRARVVGPGLALHRSDAGWRVSDMLSGRSVCWGPTRRAAAHTARTWVDDIGGPETVACISAVAAISLPTQGGLVPF
jgi:hypothetical protein